MAVAGLCLAAAFAAEARTVRMAIVAGHNRGEAQDPPLRYAESDADRFASLLSQIGGLEENNLFLLKAPTPKLVRYAFAELTRKARELDAGDEAIFYFYYSGHGDREKLKLGAQGFQLAELRGLIDSLPAKVRIGVFDACQSGSITRIKGGKAVKPLVLEQETNGKGTILITSSSDDESSQESENLQGSFFTHHWLSGLRGPADFSGDKHVSLMEAYQYAFQKTVVNTEGTTGGIQHPNAKFQVDVEGDIVLTDLASGDGGIRFPPEAVGHFLIVDKASVIMAEFTKEPEREMFLALGPGTYMVYKKEGKSLKHAQAAIALGQITVFDEKGLKRGTLYASVNKGGMDTADAPADRSFAQLRPYSAYIGLMQDQSFAGLLGVNYSVGRHIGLDFRYYFLNMMDASKGETYAFKPGLEYHFFATRHVQFMTRGGYSLGFRPGFEMVSRNERLTPCFDASTGQERPSGDPACTVSYEEEVWKSKTTVKMWEASVGIRYWLGPMLSLGISTGLEYGLAWRSKAHEIRSQPINLGLGFHI